MGVRTNGHLFAKTEPAADIRGLCKSHSLSSSALQLLSLRINLATSLGFAEAQNNSRLNQPLDAFHVHLHELNHNLFTTRAATTPKVKPSNSPVRTTTESLGLVLCSGLTAGSIVVNAYSARVLATIFFFVCASIRR